MNSRRILPYDEWDKLRDPVKACFGSNEEPPPPEIAPFCAVEEDDDGNIKGFLFLQFVPHMEPFGSLGGASFTELKRLLDTTLEPLRALTPASKIVYYIHAASPESVEVYEARGFRKKGILLEGSV